MICPACNNKMEEITVAGVKVDVCRGGCGGKWFDNFELKKFDEPHEHAGELLLEIEKDSNLAVDHSQRRKCPKCADIVMMRHFFCVKKEVEVDECPACGGIWLDDGELKKIRAAFASEEERIEAAKDYFAHVFDGELTKMRSETEEESKKVKRITNIFRFITPSYYLAGR